jgi:ketosteroid isomerase-like protein
MSIRTNQQVALDVITAVENRDRKSLGNLYHRDIEFHWPPALPYGGSHRGADVINMATRFAETWDALQPTESERRMDPEIVAANDEDVVVRYTWKARDGANRTFETETLACYKIRDGKLARAQMYYYDLTGLLEFLRDASVR